VTAVFRIRKIRKIIANITKKIKFVNNPTNSFYKVNSNRKVFEFAQH